jgi:FKBP-type peptidyl-prolyl cis-trans isomerase SlyD
MIEWPDFQDDWGRIIPVYLGGPLTGSSGFAVGERAVSIRRNKMADLNEKPTHIAKDTVVSLDYTLRVDGVVVDSSEKSEPIKFIQGHGHIISGLEDQLYGMQVGEHKQVSVSAREGYGELDESAYADIPRDEFPPDVPLKTGIGLQLRDQDGNVTEAYIREVGEKSVRLDFNHPLAGKDLDFSVEVVDLRHATAEELSHGHIHFEAGEAQEDADWEDEEEQ